MLHMRNITVGACRLLGKYVLQNRTGTLHYSPLGPHVSPAQEDALLREITMVWEVKWFISASHCSLQATSWSRHRRKSLCNVVDDSTLVELGDCFGVEVLPCFTMQKEVKVMPQVCPSQCVLLFPSLQPCYHWTPALRHLPVPGLGRGTRRKTQQHQTGRNGVGRTSTVAQGMEQE